MICVYVGKSQVTSISYNFHAPDLFRTFGLPSPTATDALREDQRTVGRARARRFRRAPSPAHPKNPAQEFRRHVYKHNCLCLRIGTSPHTGYQNLTAASFTSSPELQRKARLFLRRELQIFTFLSLDKRVPNNEFLIEYMVAVLKRFEIRDSEGRVQRLIGEYLGMENAGMVCHELEGFLRWKGEGLKEWDEVVQYLPCKKCAGG